MRIHRVYLDCRVIDTSIWCDTCLLPSALTIEITVLSENGVGPPRRITRCPTCGTPANQPETPPTT